MTDDIAPFTPEELQTVHSLWLATPADHVWTGWAAVGDVPYEVWIFRTRAHWRRFRLEKRQGRFSLMDETGHGVAAAASLQSLLARVEALPGLTLSQPPPNHRKTHP